MNAKGKLEERPCTCQSLWVRAQGLQEVSKVSMPLLGSWLTFLSSRRSRLSDSLTSQDPSFTQCLNGELGKETTKRKCNRLSFPIITLRFDKHKIGTEFHVQVGIGIDELSLSYVYVLILISFQRLSVLTHTQSSVSFFLYLLV